MFSPNRPRWSPPYEGDPFSRTIKLSGCDSWLDDNRVPSEGPLDMVETAKVLGALVDLQYDVRHPEKGRSTGFGKDTVVHARSDLAPQEQRITIAHELGHVYIDKVLLSGTYNNDDETFSEYFGHSAVIPRAALDHLSTIDPTTISSLATNHDVTEDAVIRRLMYAEKLPPKVMIQTETVKTIGCLGCTSYGYVNCKDHAVDDLTVLDFEDRTINVSSLKCREVVFREK